MDVRFHRLEAINDVCLPLAGASEMVPPITLEYLYTSESARMNRDWGCLNSGADDGGVGERRAIPKDRAPQRT